MDIEVRKLKKRDNSKAIQFAIRGMHFSWYLDSVFLLNLYGRYFWYMETNRATQVIAAYQGDTLVGVLLAQMKGEEKTNYSIWKALYVRIFDFIQQTFFQNSAGIYDKINRQMFEAYCQSNSPEGEIIFLAANPNIKIKGIGSKLLQELTKKEKGRQVYLYTDSACTYQFYEHRGFEKASEKNIILKIGKKTIPLTCFLYSKVL